MRTAEEKGPRQVALENGSGGIAKTNSGYNVKNNSFGGLVLNSSGKIASVVSLDQIDNLSPADFFERDGRYYLSSAARPMPWPPMWSATTTPRRLGSPKRPVRSVSTPAPPSPAI